MLGLDVHRTDRTLVFYEKQENLSKLWDILAVYAWSDTDIGYCQGGYPNLLFKEVLLDFRSSVFTLNLPLSSFCTVGYLRAGIMLQDGCWSVVLLLYIC